MIEYYCDVCGKKITPNKGFVERILEKCETHVCMDCAVKRIKEFAKTIAEYDNLSYASYGTLLSIYEKIADISAIVYNISSPYTHKCPVCSSEMVLKDPARYTYFCGKCVAVYDRYGKKIEG